MTGKAAEKPAEGPTAPELRRGFFAKQPMMNRMIYALAPIGVAGIYFFGWRVVALLAVSTLAGLATEWFSTSQIGRASCRERV